MEQIGSRFGVNTYSYTQSMPAAECIRRLGALGVRAFEPMLYPGHLWITDAAAQLAEVRRAVDAVGGRITSLNTPNIDLNVAAATAEMRAHSLSLNEAFLRVAGELGAGGLVLGPGKANPLFPLPAVALEGHFFAALDRLLPVAERCGVKIFAENQPFAYIPDVEGLMRAVERCGDPRVGVCYDVANAHFIGEDPLDGLARIGPRLDLIHISDTTRAAFRHDALGAGDLDYARLAGPIGALGPGVPAMLEIISADPDRDIARSAALLRAAGF